MKVVKHSVRRMITPASWQIKILVDHCKVKDYINPSIQIVISSEKNRIKLMNQINFD